MFFFSSIRRHTRWNCDWSSDVCSSDLSITRCGSGQNAKNQQTRFEPSEPLKKASRSHGNIDNSHERLLDAGLSQMSQLRRSEERRVGKECRSECGKSVE